MSKAEETIRALALALQSASYVASTEDELAEAIGFVLSREGIEFQAEASLGEHGRVDVLSQRVGIEIKHRYGLVSTLRQLDRYAQSPEIDGLILATTSTRLAAGVPSSFRGKPVLGVALRGGM